LDRGFSIIGKAVDRVDGLEKATGAADYTGDLRLPDMLYAKCLRSPYAHARIKRIDSKRAETLPGVRAVIHKDNCPGWKTYWYLIPQQAFPEIVTYVGQEVALVAADDIDTAQSAVGLVEVEYEPLPHLLDVDQAAKPDAISVHPLDEPDPTCRRAPSDPPVGNIFNGKPDILRRGNVEKGFAEADIILEETYTTSFQYHATLQTRCAIADWDGELLTVFDSGQGVWNAKLNLSKSLNLPLDKVRVITKYMGGGFGSKAAAQRSAHYAARLAMLAKRPVRLELTRPEEFVSHPHRFSAKKWLKIGAKKSGVLTAVQGKGLVNLGTGGTFGNQGEKLAEHPFTLYECPNAHLEEYGVYTNAQMTGYMRSVMRVMSNFFLESHMEHLAAALNMDPLDLRLRNYTIWGNQEKKTPYSAKNLRRCMHLASEAIGWDRRKELTESNRHTDLKRGIGIAAYIYDGVGADPYDASADVVVRSDGTVELLAGIVDIGGGQSTIFRMIAAEELGVTFDRVRIKYGDTENTKYAPGTHASRMTAEMGPAVLQAAAEARQQLFTVAALMLDARAEDLRSENDMIYAKHMPSRQISFEEVCHALGPEGQVQGSGSRAPNPTDIVLRTFGAQAAEVEVDVETGSVKVLRVASAHELGRALNPKLCVSQHYGGIIMGLGYALLEDPAFDSKTGVMLNPDLHQYRTPTSLDTPEIIAFNVEAEDPYFAYSAKAIGEATMVPTPAAIRNAIYHAAGIWLNALPMTRDKVLDALYPSEV
jgi:CO/xanthine dehydrogenase Mo-binding subunit